MQRLKKFWELVRDAGAGFKRHKGLKLSASLAFYTILTLGPMFLVVIFFADLFWGRAVVEGKLFNQLGTTIGEGAARQIKSIIRNASDSVNSFSSIIGFVVLAIAATTAFKEMQDSMNIIWNIRAKKSMGWKMMMRKRGLSFAVVAGLGFVLLGMLVVDTLRDGLMDQLRQSYPRVTMVVVSVVNILLTLLVVTGLFSILYKALPDALIQWKDVAAGALFTGVLFMIGKAGISFYIHQSDAGSSPGTPGSLIVLLLWIYYSSTILYFGAEFTKAYAMKYGSEIKPDPYAVTVQVVTVESNERSIQENEKNAAHAEMEVQKSKDLNR